MPRTGRPKKCDEALISKAESLIAQGYPEKNVCALLSLSWDTWLRWKQTPSTRLERDFSTRIDKASSVSEAKAIKAITSAFERDPRSAQWYLSHHPKTRNTWSDAAASRRAVATAMKDVVSVLNDCLPEDLRATVFQQLAALDLYKPEES